MSSDINNFLSVVRISANKQAIINCWIIDNATGYDTEENKAINPKMNSPLTAKQIEKQGAPTDLAGKIVEAGKYEEISAFQKNQIKLLTLQELSAYKNLRDEYLIDTDTDKDVIRLVCAVDPSKDACMSINSVSPDSVQPDPEKEKKVSITIAGTNLPDPGNALIKIGKEAGDTFKEEAFITVDTDTIKKDIFGSLIFTITLGQEIKPGIRSIEIADITYPSYKVTATDSLTIQSPRKLFPKVTAALFSIDNVLTPDNCLPVNEKEKSSQIRVIIKGEDLSRAASIRQVKNCVETNAQNIFINNEIAIDTDKTATDEDNPNLQILKTSLIETARLKIGTYAFELLDADKKPLLDDDKKAIAPFEIRVCKSGDMQYEEPEWVKTWGFDASLRLGAPVAASQPSYFTRPAASRADQPLAGLGLGIKPSFPLNLGLADKKFDLTVPAGFSFDASPHAGHHEDLHIGANLKSPNFTMTKEKNKYLQGDYAAEIYTGYQLKYNGEKYPNKHFFKGTLNGITLGGALNHSLDKKKEYNTRLYGEYNWDFVDFSRSTGYKDFSACNYNGEIGLSGDYKITGDIALFLSSYGRFGIHKEPYLMGTGEKAKPHAYEEALSGGGVGIGLNLWNWQFHFGYSRNKLSGWEGTSTFSAAAGVILKKAGDFSAYFALKEFEPYYGSKDTQIGFSWKLPWFYESVTVGLQQDWLSSRDYLENGQNHMGISGASVMLDPVRLGSRILGK